MSTYLNHRGESILDKLRLQRERSQLEADERAVQDTESERALERHRAQTVRRAQVDSERAAEREKLLKPWRQKQQALEGALSAARSVPILKQIREANEAVEQAETALNNHLAERPVPA